MIGTFPIQYFKFAYSIAIIRLKKIVHNVHSKSFVQLFNNLCDNVIFAVSLDFN